MENISDKIVALKKFLFKIRITVYQKKKIAGEVALSLCLLE